MNKKNAKYISTPIYYVNDRPHLGHLYTTVAADILARFYRAMDYKVFFATGTDEHGQKVAQAAEKARMTPQAYVDQMAQPFQDMMKEAEISYDDFIRTSQDRHKKAACALWTRLKEKGHIYLSSYAGWYSVRDEAFYDEQELRQEGQQKIAPTGAPVEWVEEPCYFFRLSAFQEPLLAYYEAHPEAIAPESRSNEVLSFIRSGLQDLAISRSKIQWGIPVPGDEAHVMYVWLDALTNYLTVLGYPEKTQEMDTFWPHSLHLIGKDILRFHAVYWPAFLMGADIAPPARIFAHGWWTREGQKMSKSLGNVLVPSEMIEKYGLDRVRYGLFRHVRFGNDSNFSEMHFMQQCDQDLADGLGNLAQRVLTFIQKNSQSHIKPLDASPPDIAQWAKSFLPKLEACMDKEHLYGYLEHVFQAIAKANAFMENLAPWVLVKQGQEERHQMEQGLSALVHFLRDIALILWPFIPGSAQKLLDQLGCTFDGTFKDIGTSLGHHTIGTPSSLFLKLIKNPSPKSIV